MEWTYIIKGAADTLPPADDGKFSERVLVAVYFPLKKKRVVYDCNYDVRANQISNTTLLMLGEWYIPYAWQPLPDAPPYPGSD